MAFAQVNALDYFNGLTEDPSRRMSARHWAEFVGSGKVESRVENGQRLFSEEALERAAALRNLTPDFYEVRHEGEVRLSPALAASFLPVYTQSPQAAKRELARACHQGEVTYRKTGNANEVSRDSWLAYLKRYPDAPAISSRATAFARWPGQTDK